VVSIARFKASCEQRAGWEKPFEAVLSTLKVLHVMLQEQAQIDEHLNIVGIL
jgi:hypothetical protein